MSKLNIRIHECGSSASSLGPSPMGVLRMQPTKKKSEASDGLDAEWDDLAAVLKGLFLRNVDEPSGKYFYVKSDYRNDDDILHSVYNKGQDTLFLEIHLVGTEPNMAVVNPGNYTDETFDKAYGVVEPIAQEMFRSLDSNGYHGTISKIDDALEYGAWKKQHVSEDMLANKKNENLTDKEEHEWYRFWFDDVKKHIVSGKSGSVEHNCKMLPHSDVRQMWGVAAMAKELCDNFRRYLSYRGYTNSKGSPFAEISWRAEDAGDLLAAMNKADGTPIESKKNESVNPIASIYGDGGINTYEHSADGFFPTNTDTLAKAIYNNDVETIKKLHDSNLKTYEEPDELTMGWHDDYDDFNDDSTHYWYYDWDWDYDQSFVKDFRRVIGLTDNQDALRLMLQYEPDFIVCSADFGNAIHAGYDKELIKRLFYNIRAVVDDDDDLRVNYLGDEDYVTSDNPDPIENIEKFLEG